MAGAARAKAPSVIGVGTASAVIVVVGVAIATTFGVTPLGTARAAALIALAVAFVVNALAGGKVVETRRTRAAAAVFFVSEIAIGAAILALSRGAAALAVMPLVSEAVLFGSVRFGAIVAAGLTAAQAAVIWEQGGTVADVARTCGAFLAACAFVVVFTRIAVNERAARARADELADELGEANAKLREYAAKATDLAMMNERNRVAREIHDTLGHSLTVMHVQLEAARAVLARDPERALAAIVRARDLADQGLAEVRRSVAMLRQSPLEGRPLTSAIAALVEEARTTGLEASLAVDGEARPLAPPKEFALYRAAQEALTNVRKHARARKVEVRLSYGGEVKLHVADDGAGDPGGARSGFGLIGLRERVALVGGTVSIDTAPGDGFRLAVELPE